MKKHVYTLAIGLSLIFASCEKEYDAPPIAEIPEGKLITLTDLRKMYTDSVTNFNLDVDSGKINKEIREAYRFKEDYSVYATVTADEKSGNLYKNVYVQDDNAAITLGLVYGGGLYQGDKIRINLNGLKLWEDNGMLLLDSVDAIKKTVKVDTKIDITPITVTLADIDTAFEKYESKLVKIEGIEMSPCDRGATWADAVTKSGANRYIDDCNGYTLLVRTSGYASFAGDVTPSGSGSIVGVLGQYGEDAQLYIRSKGEIQMNNSICSNVINGNDWTSLDGIESCGWTTYNEKGLQGWEAKYIGGNTFANISGYDGSNYNLNKDWLISPKIDVTANAQTKLNFRSAKNYTGITLKVLVSTDYVGKGNPNNATWNEIFPTLSPGNNNWAWVNSGDIDLSAYNSNNVFIAFLYESTSSGASTWEIDDVVISKQ